MGDLNLSVPNNKSYVPNNSKLYGFLGSASYDISILAEGIKANNKADNSRSILEKFIQSA